MFDIAEIRFLPVSEFYFVLEYLLKLVVFDRFLQKHHR